MVFATLGVMGFIASIPGGKPVRSPRTLLASFVFLSLAGVGLAVGQAILTEQSQSAADHKIADLQKQVDSSVKAIGAMAGEGSFCYLDFNTDFVTNDQYFNTVLVNKGKNPVRNLTFHVLDLNTPAGYKAQTKPYKDKGGRNVLPRDWHRTDIKVHFMKANEAKFFPTLSLLGNDGKKCTVFFEADNGQWMQNSQIQRRYTKLGEIYWVQASRVFDDQMDIVFEKIDRDFPREKLDPIIFFKPSDTARRPLTRWMPPPPRDWQ